MHQIYTVGLPCTLATVTPDNVLRPVHYQAYMQVKLGTCWHQPDSFSLHIFRNTSYEFTHSSKVITLSAFSSRRSSAFSLAGLLPRRICCRRAERFMASLQCKKELTRIVTATWIRRRAKPSRLAHIAEGT